MPLVVSSFPSAALGDDFNLSFDQRHEQCFCLPFRSSGPGLHVAALLHTVTLTCRPQHSSAELVPLVSPAHHDDKVIVGPSYLLRQSSVAFKIVADVPLRVCVCTRTPGPGDLAS
jgi:hypothetical protein